MKKVICFVCALTLLLGVCMTALAEDNWVCPECGARVPVSLGDLCPKCGALRPSSTPDPTPTAVPTAESTPTAIGGHAPWDCPAPGCGRTGNKGNYCGNCGHPAPWMETPDPSAAEASEADLQNAHEIIDETDKTYNTPFAYSAVFFNGDRVPGNRTEETNLGDLITDAMVWTVVTAGSISVEELSSVVGITNGGGIRAPIAAGDVTVKDVNTVLPFGNTVAVIRVTGAELLEALEASTFCTPDPVGGFPQTSGLVWTLDTTKAYDQGELYVVDGKETIYYAPRSIRRVSIESVNGEPFDAEEVYVVVTNNFCASGGDTYGAFFRAYSEGSFFDTAIPLDEAVVNYIREQLNSYIGAEPQGGRLTIIQ